MRAEPASFWCVRAGGGGSGSRMAHADKHSTQTQWRITPQPSIQPRNSFCSRPGVDAGLHTGFLVHRRPAARLLSIGPSHDITEPRTALVPVRVPVPVPSAVNGWGRNLVLSGFQHDSFSAYPSAPAALHHDPLWASSLAASDNTNGPGHPRCTKPPP